MDSQVPDKQTKSQADSAKNGRKTGFRAGSIRYRLLFLLLGIAAVVSLVITLIAVDTTRQQSRQASEISTLALQEQAETYLLQITERNANENDLTLELLRNSAIQLANFAAEVYDNPEAFSTGDYWRYEDHMFLGEDGQYLNGEADLTSVFVPHYQEINEDVIRDVEMGGHLEFQMRSLFESNPSITAVYYASKHEVTRYYPNIRLGLLVPNDFTVTQRVWFTDVAPDNNPNREALWSTVYVDATGQGLVTTASSPVYSQGGEFIGVVGFDVTLVDMTADVEATRVLESGYTFLMDQSGQSVALPEQGYLDILGRPSATDEASAFLNETTGVYSGIINEMLAGKSGFQRVDQGGEVKYVAYAPLVNSRWSLGMVVEENEILASVSELQAELDLTSRELVTNRVLPAAIVLFIIVAILGWILTTRLVRPIQKLSGIAEQVANGQWDVVIPQSGSDEIGRLGQAFSSMTGQLRQTLYGLEQQVADRTTALAIRSSYLQAAADVGRAAATLRNLDELLPLVTRLISEQFGFYHVGIFLLDENKEYAVLRAANSEGGQRMLERGHRLLVGQQGIVGYVTSHREPRIALNVGDDAVYFENPDLPITQSEMALPLVVGTELLGALDVQSSEPSAFSEQDVRTLQVLADQVAISINSAQLVQQLEQVLASERLAYGDISSQAWREQTRGMANQGFVRSRTGIVPLKDVQDHQTKIILSNNQPVIDPDDPSTLYLPVQIRGKVVAGLRLMRSEDSGSWTADDIQTMETLAVQLGVALESARAYQATQTGAQRERLLSEIGSKVRETLDIDFILRAATQEVQKAMGFAKVVVKLGVPQKTGSNGGNGHTDEMANDAPSPEHPQPEEPEEPVQGDSHE